MNEIAEVFSAEELQEVETTEEVEEVEETKSPESEKVEEKEAPEKVEKEKEKPETTSEEETAKAEWTFAAVKDERQKRQKLEKELEELRANLDKKEEKAPDVFDDQEAYTKHLEQKFESKTKEQILNVQRDMMLEFKPDYEEKEKAFFEVAKDNPALIQQARNASNPAKFAYEQGEKYLKYQDIQNVETLESKLRSELEKKIRSELEAEYKEKTEKGANLSPSLAKVRGSNEKEEVLPENPIDIFN